MSWQWYVVYGREGTGGKSGWGLTRTSDSWPRARKSVEDSSASLDRLSTGRPSRRRLASALALPALPATSGAPFAVGYGSSSSRRTGGQVEGARARARAKEGPGDSRVAPSTTCFPPPPGPAAPAASFVARITVFRRLLIIHPNPPVTLGWERDEGRRFHSLSLQPLHPPPLPLSPRKRKCLFTCHIALSLPHARTLTCTTLLREDSQPRPSPDSRDPHRPSPPQPPSDEVPSPHPSRRPQLAPSPLLPPSQLP